MPQGDSERAAIEAALKTISGYKGFDNVEQWPDYEPEGYSEFLDAAVKRAGPEFTAVRSEARAAALNEAAEKVRAYANEHDLKRGTLAELANDIREMGKQHD